MVNMTMISYFIFHFLKIIIKNSKQTQISYMDGVRLWWALVPTGFFILLILIQIIITIIIIILRPSYDTNHIVVGVVVVVVSVCVCEWCNGGRLFHPMDMLRLPEMSTEIELKSSEISHVSW